MYPPSIHPSNPAASSDPPTIPAPEPPPSVHLEPHHTVDPFNPSPLHPSVQSFPTIPQVPPICAIHPGS
ncbi:hypothetical protein BDQ17DRAFT_1371199, partial [Cyathus striatus]